MVSDDAVAYPVNRAVGYRVIDSVGCPANRVGRGALGLSRIARLGRQPRPNRKPKTKPCAALLTLHTPLVRPLSRRRRRRWGRQRDRLLLLRCGRRQRPPHVLGYAKWRLRFCPRRHRGGAEDVTDAATLCPPLRFLLLGNVVCRGGRAQGARPPRGPRRGEGGGRTCQSEEMRDGHGRKGGGGEGKPREVKKCQASVQRGSGSRVNRGGGREAGKARVRCRRGGPHRGGGTPLRHDGGALPPPVVPAVGGTYKTFDRQSARRS